MKIIKTFYYELWHNMPIWLLMISIFLLYPLFSIVDSPKNGLVYSIGIMFVLFFTSLVMSIFKNVNLFKNKKGPKIKYLANTFRILVFIILSFTIIITIEYISQMFVYSQHYYIFGSHFPYFFVPCLVLSQYGSFATANTLKTTLSYCVNISFGFGAFLVVTGSTSLFLSRYRCLSSKLSPKLNLFFCSNFL